MSNTTEPSAYDVAQIRARFPALAMHDDGRAVAFFDGPGGTQVPRAVIEAVAGYYETSNANEGGAFLTSHRSDAMTVRAHEAVADFLNARSGHEIKFGANMTTLTFHISRSIGKTWRPSDEIVVTTLDHEANVSPWRAIAEDRGVTVRTVDIHPEDGTLDLDDLGAKLSDRTRLVAVGYASNALGTINPVGEIIRRAHAAGALAYIDAVHFAPHGPIDVQAMDADFLVCSAYKFFGPHLGALYGKEALLDALPAYKVRPAHDRFETGTPNLEGIAGTLAAIDYLAWVGERFGEPYRAAYPRWTGRRLALKTAMRAIRAYELDLFGELVEGLERIPGLHLWGIRDRDRFDSRTPTAAITIDGCAPRELAEALGERGITTWNGDFYAQGLIERLGLFDAGGVLRIGLAHYNTAAEVERLITALGEIVAA